MEIIIFTCIGKMHISMPLHFIHTRACMHTHTYVYIYFTHCKTVGDLKLNHMSYVSLQVVHEVMDLGNIFHDLSQVSRNSQHKEVLLSLSPRYS